MAMSFRTRLWLAAVGFFIVCCSSGECSYMSQTGVCITNCGQCKEMFGDYFHGQACAESCLATAGLTAPDCNNPSTLQRFLKRYK